ncbi:MAG: CDP-alcohol phosphatidyltransferase family protein [Acidimicrobiales bacterium]
MASTYDPSTGAATTGDADALLARVWTLPNAITVSRLVLLGAFIAALFPLHERVVAFFLLAVTGITDFLDGYIARHHNQVTTIGKIIDPSVDRVVLITSVVCVVAFGAVPVWLAVVVLGREVIVSATVLVLAALGAARIDVNWFGKAGTFGLMCDLPLFVLAHGPGGWTHAVEITAWVIVVPALAFSFWGAVLYVPAARRALAAGRRGADGAST